MKNIIKKIYCDNNSCVIRYYSNEKELSIGLIRVKYVKKKGKMIDDTIIIVQTNINNILKYYKSALDIKNEAVKLIKKTIKNPI
jgi:hypothetical protein